jgi:hypothetical protein
MVLNNDLLFVVGSFIVGGIFTYSFYNYILFTTINKGESLVNTLPNLDSINELPESTLPVMQPNILHKIDVGVQTSNIQVEAVQPGNLHIDVGVQTSSNSLFSMFKDWLMELFSIRSSQIPTPAEVRIENWLDNLDSSQVVSTPTANSVVSLSNLQRVDPIFNESLALEYAKSQANFDIGSRAEYFNTISPQLDVDLHNIMINDTQYMFAVINDVLLTIDPNIFNLFM